MLLNISSAGLMTVLFAFRHTFKSLSVKMRRNYNQIYRKFNSSFLTIEKNHMQFIKNDIEMTAFFPEIRSIKIFLLLFK